VEEEEVVEPPISVSPKLKSSEPIPIRFGYIQNSLLALIVLYNRSKVSPLGDVNLATVAEREAQQQSLSPHKSARGKYDAGEYEPRSRSFEQQREKATRDKGILDFSRVLFA
jgi:hypothetical protein